MAGVPSGGRVSRDVNPFSGKSVAHSAKAWAAIRSQWQKQPFNQPVYDPMKSLSGKSLYDAVNTVTNQNLTAANAPHQANITQAQGQQKAISDRLGGIDKLVGGQLQGVAQNAQKLEGEDQNRIAQNAQQAADRLSQTGTGINTELGADAANRGPGLEGGARDQIARELAAQKTAGSSTAGSNSLLAGQLGNSLSGLTNTMVGTAAMRGRESQGDVANRYAQMIGKEQSAMSANADKLPAERTNLLLSLRDKEFTRAATTEKLQLTGQKNQADAANKAAQTRLQGQQLTRQQQRDAELAREFGIKQSDTKAMADARNAVTTRGQDLAAARRQRTAARGSGAVSARYNSDFNNAYNYTFTNGSALGALTDRNKAIAAIQKTTKAGYGAAAAAYDAIRRRYPQRVTGGSAKLG